MKIVRKVLFFLPCALGILLYGSIVISNGLDMVNIFVWPILLMLLISGILMNMKKSWGAIFGILVGCILIYMGTQETGQIIKETPFGIIMCIYYLICGYISFKNKN